MNILALDLGSRFGYAILEEKNVISGSRRLPNKTFGQRFSEFRKWLIKTITQYQISEVYFERVQRHIGTEAAHVFGGFMYMLAAVCTEFGIRCDGVPVGTIKKGMTGKGRASKQDMIDAAFKMGFKPFDDNEADAIALLLTEIQASKNPERVLLTPVGERSAWARIFASGRSFSEDDRKSPKKRTLKV